ncbi:hypothetical protein HOD29_05475 [archaeon]|nr:hypothetical protein [archaeon]
MTKKKRIRKNTQRRMHLRSITGKKPMTTAQKAERKEKRESQRAAALAANEAKKKVVKKE